MILSPRLPRSAATRRSALLLATTLLSLGCGDDGAPSAASDVTPGPVGAACRRAADCASGVCLTSEFGPPFCTAACDAAWEACPASTANAAPGQATPLCVSMRALPHPELGPFDGALDQFCVPRCANALDCRATNPSWETCEPPSYLGDPLYPALGAVKVCQAPSHQGKEPVDPARCDWDKTVAPRYANEANLCRSYCAWLDRCKARTSEAAAACCAWGCFNRIVVDDTVVDAWRDTVMCVLETAAAYPDTGPANSCSEPPLQCGGTPLDPTPPSALPR